MTNPCKFCQKFLTICGSSFNKSFFIKNYFSSFWIIWGCFAVGGREGREKGKGRGGGGKEKKGILSGILRRKKRENKKQTLKIFDKKQKHL